MTTDFSYGGKQIVSGGPFKPSGEDMPVDARTRVETYADIASIPDPYVGLKITVKVDETNNNKMTDYIVKSLKADSLGIANSLIDEVVRYVDYLGVTSGGGVGEKGEKGDPGATFIPSVNSDGLLTWTNNGNLNNPPSINIKGPKGDTGLQGPAGTFDDSQLASYQTKNDSTLNTTDKTVVGAINEVKSDLFTSLNGKKFSNPMTKAEYDDISEIDPNTIYLVDDNESIIGVPDYSSSDANKVLAVNSNGTALAWIDVSSGSGEGLTTEQIEQLNTAYNHSQSPHVTTDDVSMAVRSYVNSNIGLLKGDKGDKGDTGATGQDGITPTLRVGSVTTLEAGNNATVTMSESNNEYTLNFGIPKGQKGADGVSGSVEVVNDLTTGGANKALSAEQGKVIKSSLETIEMEIEGLEQGGNLVVSDVEEGEIFEIDYSKPIVSVTGVTLNKSTTIVPKGSTEILTATIAPSNATDKSVTWSSSNNSIAIVNNGVVTGVANGNCNITVTTVDGNHTASCGVTVETATIPVQSITLNKSSHAFKVDETFQLTPIFNPSNSTNKNVTWSSNNANCTVVDGLVTGKVEGESVVTCTSEDGNHTATCTITVQAKDDTSETQSNIIYEEDGYLCVPVEKLGVPEITSYSRDKYKVFQISQLSLSPGATDALIDINQGIDTILKDVNITKGTWDDVTNSSNLTELYAIRPNYYITFKILTSNLGDKTIVQYFKDVVFGEYVKFKLKTDVNRYILDESLLNNFVIKSASNFPNAQCCRVNYPNVPRINPSLQFNSWGFAMRTNAVSNEEVESIGLHSTNNFIEFLFKPNTFTEFTLDKLKEYINVNKLTIWITEVI